MARLQRWGLVNKNDAGDHRNEDWICGMWRHDTEIKKIQDYG
jgi:hypothetical protein